MSSASMQTANYVNPWRKTYEMISVGSLWTASSYLIYNSVVNDVNTPHINQVAFGLACFASYRSVQAGIHLKGKVRLLGYAPTIITPEMLNKELKKDRTFLGWGYTWNRDHAQKVRDILKLGPHNVVPDSVFTSLLRASFPKRFPSKDVIGSPWIHGLFEKKEESIQIFNKQLKGNTCIFGVPGAGKTRLLELLMLQAAYRDEPIFILDPKGDQDLERSARKAASHHGRPFYLFSATRHAESVRMDPLKYFGLVTELADRIVLLTEDNNPSFQNFSWESVEKLCAAMIYVQERPTIRSIKGLLDLGVSSLTTKVVEMYFQSRDTELYQQIKSTKKGMSQDEYLTSIIAKYRAVDSGDREIPVDGIISLYEHPEEHFQKMIVNITPVLTQLTSGPLEALLSPDPLSDDERPIVDARHVIDKRAIFYLSLSNMSNKKVASAVGSMFLQELAAVAGHDYDFGDQEKLSNRVIQIMCDECNEIVDGAGGPTLVKLLNKGRGVGYRLTVGTQTLNDWVTGLQSKDQALQVMGLTNNAIALRTTCPTTKEFFEQRFGPAYINTNTYTINNGSSGNNGDITDYSAGFSERVNETDGEMFPSSLLEELCDLEGVIKVAGGSVNKVRLPIVKA